MKTTIEVQSPKSKVQRMATSSIGSGLLAELFRFSMSVRLLLAVALSVSLTGCFGFLKPAKPTARHFVLTTLPAAEPAAKPGGTLAVGVGPIKLAAYLFNTSFAVRKGTNEIDYLPATFWAERLDSGLQRTLAANLATLLPTDQIRISAWQTADVSAEVYVAIDQFDVDARGQGMILAWWRILSPGGEKTLKAGECRLTRQGPAPQADPSGSIATLSELAAELSRQVAQAVKETTPGSGGAR
ncbi:MAG: PqiC family protein [Verrucomicrobia bacterium]|nr:PqiC family protein [Verrucomicrobiota bacterium]